jgi:hypothetical protein
MKHPMLRPRDSIPESKRAWNDKSSNRLALYGITRASLVLTPKEMLSKPLAFFKKAPCVACMTSGLDLQNRQPSGSNNVCF